MIWLIDFAQTCFWLVLISTIVYCEGSENLTEGGFFSSRSLGNTYALAIAGAAQPFVGFMTDQVGARINFIFWLSLMAAVSLTIPIFVNSMGDNA